MNVAKHLLNVKPTNHPRSVKCANNQTISSSKTGVLNLPSLPLGARNVHLFDGISEPLLSIGVLCDNGLKATFDSTKVDITNTAGEVVLSGNRDSRRMYMLPIAQPNVPPVRATNVVPDTASVANASIFSLLSTARSVAQRVAFTSSMLGNPADSTLVSAALATHLKSIPNVTTKNIQNFLPNSIESAKGHLDQSRQGTWSTKLSKRSIRQIQKQGCRGYLMAVQLCDENSLHGSTLHADLTGPYPVISHKGNKKVMIGWCEYGNFIKSVPVKGDSSEELITGYNTLVTFFNDKLADKGAITAVIRLDNQTSSHLETYFKNVAKATFNYVPPGNHRALHAERDIRTWKGHFKATRAGTDKSFPANLWDELLPHVDMTLNILRPCNVEPNKSAWDFMCGEWDYKRHPIGPAGAKVLVYENPESRASYADNGVEGFYLGYAPNHYRCHRVWIPPTRDFRDSDTLSWHLSDPFGLLSNHSATDDISRVIDILNIASTNAPSRADKDFLQQGATLLLDHIASPTSGPSAVPNVPTEPTSTVGPPRVMSNPPADTRQHRATTRPSSNAPIARVIPVNESQHENLSVPITIARSSHHLRTNKNHVTIDQSPTTHQAAKVISHKGSDSTPNNPLRFRIRWLGFTHTSDTFEPFEHVQYCKAFTDYIEAHPKLWYLMHTDNHSFSNSISLPAQQQLPKTDSTVNALTKATKPPAVPTYHDASYASVLHATDPTLTAEPTPDKCTDTPLNKFEMYDLLNMPYTTVMNDNMWVAHAAGDMDDDGQELKFKSCIVGPDKDHWLKADVTEYRKLLSQYKVMHPIKFSNIPAPKKEFVTYYNRQCKTKIKNGETHYRVRGTYGGNKKSSYTGITASYQASMTTVKMLLNKTISDPASKWMTMDITDMYLHSDLPTDQWEYMVISLKDIPQEIISEFNLADFVAPGDNKIYLEVVKALYGMKQAGYIANLDVVEHLTKHGYTSQMSTPCLFRHHTDDVEFTLVTDDFGVRYGNKAAADNLLAVMSSKYPMLIS